MVVICLIGVSLGISFMAVIFAITWIVEIRRREHDIENRCKEEYNEGFDDGYKACLIDNESRYELVIEEMDEEIQKLWQEMDQLI